MSVQEKVKRRKRMSRKEFEGMRPSEVMERTKYSRKKKYEKNYAVEGLSELEQEEAERYYHSVFKNFDMEEIEDEL